MKHVFLVGLCVLSISAAVAQTNVGTVTQVGNSLTGNIGQTGTGLTGVVSQTASNPITSANNSGIISQTGTNHNALIEQNNGSTYNKALITQSGSSSGNVGYITQSNGSGGSSASLGNTAAIDQDGAANRAGIFQDGTNTTTNAAEIWQAGDNNGRPTAGARGDVYIDQSGSTSNRAEVYQGDDTRNGTVIGIAGTASSNGAQIDQQGGSQSNTAVVRQFSDNNNARVRQDGPNSQSNVTTITQDGNGNNTAYVDQGGSEGYDSRNNQATIVQAGQSSTATVQQFYYAQNGIVTITQGADGSGNSALAVQFNTSAESNTISIGQNETSMGMGNVAIVLQGTTSPFSPTSGGNRATISQEDSFNYTGLFQTGQTNTAIISQAGNGNAVTSLTRDNPLDSNLPNVAVQDGTGNRMDVGQQANAGIANTANIIQTGVNQTTFIRQTGN
ncbi:hypothetical protein [Spirosoma montaniterrae]|uniref:Curlin associated repeat-containing protein n=1 Tax=Spirosoma montaniterrae TaxID=1178516 RepID=A0A1P9WZU2_9BACT|nr:hypothetical protein [Spirosoma montaniterrae]AQG80855.1 hypothetical protein AWR27_16935 [Spirosoma montaniterrae]